MKLFNRTPKPRSNENSDKFHAELLAIVEAQDITFVEAFVQYMDNANLADCSRKTIDQYLFGKGFCVVDIQILADEYFRIVDSRK